MSDYPEHDKLIAGRARAEAVGEFRDWLESQGIYLMRAARYLDSNRDEWVMAGNFSDLVGLWLGIDPAELEKEKRLMLARLRNGSKI